jgi:polysaccharide export outer membrane protein
MVYMNLRQIKTALSLAAVLLGLSCTPYKDVPYFQDLPKDRTISEAIDNYKPLLIQPGDLLAVHVNSLNPRADGMFNYNLDRISGSGLATPTSSINESFITPSQNAVYGYLVDDEGNIHLPEAGAVKVSGLTTLAISEKLGSLLTEYLSKPTVTVRILNFRVSVLGDVKVPGTYTVPNERITLMEALALAGDLNSTGVRKNVLLVRETDGARKYITLDLTSKEIFKSPYFYLKNSDIIYVQPNRERVNADSTAFQKAGLVLSLVSILVLIFYRK